MPKSKIHKRRGKLPSISLIKASTASSASPETPPKSLMPAAANAVCAPPPIPPQIRTSAFNALRTPANAPCPLPFEMCIRDRHL